MLKQITLSLQVNFSLRLVKFNTYIYDFDLTVWFFLYPETLETHYFNTIPKSKINFHALTTIPTGLLLLRKHNGWLKNQEIPPTSEPPLDFEEETSRSQAIKETEKADTAEVSSDPMVAVDVGPIGEKAEKVEKAPKDVSQ